MTFKQRQAHNALTFGDGYATTGPCWQQHNTDAELASYWRARANIAEVKPDAMDTRRSAAVLLDHAIARIGYYGPDGWFRDGLSQDIHDAANIIRHAKWSLEAMDSPASNRFWDEQRRDYNTMLASIDI